MRRTRNTLKKVFMVSFCLTLVCSLGIVFMVERHKYEVQRDQMQYFALTKSNAIIKSILGLLYKAEALSALVIQGNGRIDNFESIAAIISNHPAIRNILIAPNGIVSNVYPFQENEKVLGFDMLSDMAGNKEALLARETGKLTMGGPFDMVQDGQAIVGRLPVFMFNKGERVFWGFVSITLRYPEALFPVSLEDLSRMGYSCEIWRISPDTNEKQIILGNMPTKKAGSYVEKTFDLLNARWMISISPQVSWYKNIMLYVELFVALFVSLVAALLAQNYVDTLHMKNFLEDLSLRDVLTGLPNRRSLFRALNEELELAKKGKRIFGLCYMDLNGFKNVNDTYGHMAGDIVLVEAAKRFRKVFAGDNFISRVGGDEFIVIIRNDCSDEHIQNLVQSLEESFEIPISVSAEHEVKVGISSGLAFFPRNGTTIEELTSFADSSMYKTKRKFRPQQRESRM